jgi:hypothetical protein
VEAIMKYMGIIMALLYLVLGVAVITSSNGLFNLPEPYAKIFGSILILYGAFRSFRIYQKYFRD